MKKAPEAFRTISEVSEILETPAHVLRFWESKFYQIRPVKRAGGRRYYRPDDVALINGIRVLLQEQGMTIRGVQRVLQEQGIKHVASLGGSLPMGESGDEIVEEPWDQTEADQTVPDHTEAGERSAAFVPATSSSETDAPQTDAAEVPAAEDRASSPLSAPVPTTAHEPANATGRDLAEPAAGPAAMPAADMDREGEDRQQLVTASRFEDQTAETSDAAAEPVAMPEPDAEDLKEDAMTETESLPPAAAAMAFAPPLSGAVEMDETLAQEMSEVAVALPSDLPDEIRVAKRLRGMQRGELGRNRDSVDLLSRRIDALLERMSEASGAGRW